MNRRGFLQLGLGIIAAPAIVRADSLMKGIPWDRTILTEASLEETIVEFMAYTKDKGGISLKPTHLIVWPGVKEVYAYNYSEAEKHLNDFKEYWK